MNDTIYRQAAIDEIKYELEMINSALDSITLDFNAKERLRQRKGEAREILNSIQQLPSAQPEIIYCKHCRKYNKSPKDQEDYCPLYYYHGMSFGDEYDLEFCSYAEKKTDDD